MRARFTFLRLFASLFGVQFLFYVVYIVLVVTAHGASDWFQDFIWLIYGRVGGLLLLPFIQEREVGIGILQLFGPLIAILIYSAVFAALIKIFSRSRAA